MRPPEILERALSIRQPYVELIYRGIKQAEYRSRPTRIRGRVYIHASKSFGDVQYGLDEGITQEEMDELPRGAITGSVEIVDCAWDGECYAWNLRHPRRYDRALRAGGCPQPGFWFPRWGVRAPLAGAG